MKKKIALACFSAGLLFGCASNVDPHVNLIGSLGNISIVSGSIKSAPNLNGLLVAQASLKNKGGSPVTGFYRCKFTDLNGMQLGDDQIWQQVTIYPNATQNVKCMATEKEAANFQLEFSANGSNVNAIQ